MRRHLPLKRLLPCLAGVLLAFFSTAQTPAIVVQQATVARQLQMPWRTTIAVGRAHNLLRADMQEHLATAQKVMGYKYCRFHAIFDDEMDVVRREKSTGQLAPGR
jgi:hypothetical protein